MLAPFGRSEGGPELKTNKALLGALTVAIALGACSTSEERIDAPDPAQRRVVFSCEDSRSITVEFKGRQAVLDVNGTSVQLEQQPAASGIRYAGGGHDLRGKGADLSWKDSGGAVHQCREQGADAVDAASLSGSKWRLVHFQSSDDTIGTIVPPNVGNYAIEFMADGALAMRLDCNRASGRWEASHATSRGGSLTLTVGPMTRAMCAEGALDTRIARDSAKVRSYTLEKGRLSLALEADAGIYVWEPAGD